MEYLFKDFNILLTENQLKKLELFKNLLQFYNKEFNITAIIEDTEIYVKHFLDSILGESLFKLNTSVIEIGSGGGFPSIPLKIMREDLNFTLVEATGKKCSFLNTVIKELDLKNIKVINQRAEILAKNLIYRENFDYATARAVAKINTLSEYCLPFVKVGGQFIAYKGTVDELDEGKNAIKILGGKISDIKTFNLPQNSGERNIIIIDKIKKTEVKYPRGSGKERSKPL